MPILLFAVAFGLSTDYAVFLLSRIKEARDNGASDSECVAIGLERTGRIVTAAALLFAVAIGAFATSQIIFIKENGVGTALAVLIDASIIRALLVPSLMELLGKWNWWAPKPLRRLHERFGISEAALPEPGREAGTRALGRGSCRRGGAPSSLCALLRWPGRQRSKLRCLPAPQPPGSGDHPTPTPPTERSPRPTSCTLKPSGESTARAKLRLVTARAACAMKLGCSNQSASRGGGTDWGTILRSYAPQGWSPNP